MTSQATPLVRRNVWTLPAGDTTLEEYAEAVAIMKSRHANDPTSWTYQAAMHGTHATTSEPLWNGCQHGTWFFLAWHRMFIYYFERIVRAAVVQAGGSPNWTLPFWDYGAGGEQATIPAAFRQKTVNGKNNSLFVSERATGINQGFALPPPVTSPAHALGRPRFTGTAQFGGGVTPVRQFSNSTGQLEQTPHNVVHDAVGGQNGWMSDPDQAAADPIFWLHHSNIDRIWSIWNSPTHKDPTDTRWVGQQFSFFDTHGSKVQKTCSQVLDIKGQLGYTYEAAPPQPAAAVPAAAAITTMDSDSDEPPEPELVGASDEPVQLVGSQARVSFEIDSKAKELALAAADTAEPSHTYLSVEDIEAEKNPGTVYGLYLNLPDGASPETAESHHAGNVSFFGVERALRPRGDEHPHSLRFVHEITELTHRLAAQGEWDGQHVTVTFRPYGLIPPDRPELGHALPEAASDSEPPVTIGRVSILYS
jgi:tyrosinase